MKRTIYKKNPLIEVICQVNYPAILSIEATEPTQFQDLVRDKYPQYQIGNEYEDEIMVNLKGNSAETQLQRHAVTKIHNFIAQDGSSRVVITKNRMTFSVKEYEKWESFYKNFSYIFKIFDNIYRPTYYNRVGLRYINIIDRKKLSIDASWNQLIKSQLLGFNSLEDSKYVVKSTVVQSELEYNNMNARILSGIVINNDNKEQCYKIDCDYYKLGSFEQSSIDGEFDALHSNFQYFFNDSITDKLIEVLEPIEERI